MYCLRCGRQISDDSIRCPFCGCYTENTEDFSDIMNPIENEKKNTENGFGVAAITLGIIGIVFAWLFALLGYVFGGGALALALVMRSKDINDSKWKAGLILSIVALVCSIISSIIGIILLS